MVWASDPAYLETNSATSVGLVAGDDVLGHDRAREAAVANREDDVVEALDPLVEVRPLDADGAVRRALGAGRGQRVAARAALARTAPRRDRSGSSLDTEIPSLPQAARTRAAATTAAVITRTRRARTRAASYFPPPCP